VQLISEGDVPVSSSVGLHLLGHAGQILQEEQASDVIIWQDCDLTLKQDYVMNTLVLGQPEL